MIKINREAVRPYAVVLTTPVDRSEVHEDRITAVDRRRERRGKSGNQAWRREVAGYLNR